MSEAKHTPGPWQVRTVGTTADHEGNERLIAEVFAEGNELIVDATYVEDARLIAAAPDLLEVAQDLLDTAKAALGTEHPSVISARAAISRATQS